MIGQAQKTRSIASPLARRLAANNNIDLATLRGSGPRGRIIKRDLEKILAGGGGAPMSAQGLGSVMSLMPDYESLPNSPMRRSIAKRLTAAARDIPHFNVSLDAEIDALLDLRRKINDRESATRKISINDFVVRAVALALVRHPDVNVSFTDEAVLRFSRVDISVAVAIDGGLITPIIRNAQAKGLLALAEEMSDLATRARAGSLQPEDYQGGTFTISNMGMFGVKGFNSIINPPQGGILSVGAGLPSAVVRDSELGVATLMTLTLAVDHRCIDGGVAAAFIKDLKGLLEDPLSLLL